MIIAVALVVSVATLAFAYQLGARYGSDFTDSPTATYATFTDEQGRVCTVATTDSAVAIDCDYPPAENRLGGWLEELNQETP